MQKEFDKILVGLIPGFFGYSCKLIRFPLFFG